MNSKSNQILLGIIILLIGALALLQAYIKINYGALVFIVVGSAFILLYLTKKKSWSLVIGSYLIYFGLVGVLNWLGLKELLKPGIAAMFFIVPGIIFMVLYYDKNKRGLLLPACLLVAFGLYVLTIGLWDARGFHDNFFFIYLGAGFLASYIIGRDFMGKTTLYIAACLFAIGIFTMLGISPVGILLLLFKIVACFAILVGVFIIARAILRK